MDLPKFKRVCAWCKKVVAEGDPGAPETHTICNECDLKKQEEAETKEDMCKKSGQQ